MLEQRQMALEYSQNNHDTFLKDLINFLEDRVDLDQPRAQARNDYRGQRGGINASPDWI